MATRRCLVVADDAVLGLFVSVVELTTAEGVDSSLLKSPPSVVILAALANTIRRISSSWALLTLMIVS